MLFSRFHYERVQHSLDLDKDGRDQRVSPVYISRLLHKVAFYYYLNKAEGCDLKNLNARYTGRPLQIQRRSRPHSADARTRCMENTKSRLKEYIRAKSEKRNTKFIRP